MPESHAQPEYVWRFKLSDDEDEALHPDALTEMVRRELRALLGCVVLTGSGEDLKVTGFRFLGGPDADHAIYAGLHGWCPHGETASGPEGGDDDATA